MPNNFSDGEEVVYTNVLLGLLRLVEQTSFLPYFADISIGPGLSTVKKA